MNISIVTSHFSLFITCNELWLARGLADLGHTVNVITTSVRSPRELMDSGQVQGYSSQKFEVNRVPTLINLQVNPFVYGVSEYMEESEVVILQEDYPFICHKAFNECRKRKIPTVLTTKRTNWPENFFVRNIYRLFDSTRNKKLREGATAIVANCTAAKEFWINTLGVKKPIELIHVGVDTQIFKPEKVKPVELNEGRFKILTVARAYPFKGLRYLIEAMEYVSKKVPGVKCYILGKGPERKNLEKLISQLNLERIVSFIDKAIPNQQMPELYSQCDVYVQPSIVEPFGIAVLEAMACGKPVIGTNVGGMLDTIKDGVTGYRVEPKNSKELGEKITKLLLDPERMKEMGKNAREHAKKFDWKVIASKYDKLIRRIYGFQ